jgi:RNA polymerase sigma factor FliA
MNEDSRLLWRRYRSSRDPEIRDRLIRETIGLVRIVAGRLALRLPPHVERDDLESAGIPGLLGAIESYDPEIGVEFASYAQVRIRGAILDELRSLDSLPRGLREKAREFNRVTARLEQRLQRPPDDQEVVAELGMSFEEYSRICVELRAGLQLSLEAGTGENRDEDDSVGEPPTIADRNTPDPWQSIALKERKILLGEIIDQLPGNERTVLSLYYYEELTMKEIAVVLDLSESRVSQIHSAALRSLRKRLQRRQLNHEDLVLPAGRLSGERGLAHAVP